MRMRSIAVQTSHYVPWSVFVCSAHIDESCNNGRADPDAGHDATWQCDPRAAAMRLYVK